jgi:hypothetical protein
MVTRRAMLKGTAAGSIAVIASAHGVAASAAPPTGPVPIPYPNGVGVGYGNLEGGAVGGFLKVTDGFNVFFKFHKTGAEVFMKEDVVVGAIDTHIKFFDEGWSALQYLGQFDGSLGDAIAGFYKLDAGVAGIFLKYTDDGKDSFRYLSVYANGEYNTEPPDYSGYCNKD